MSKESHRHVYGLHAVSRLLGVCPQRVNQVFASSQRDDAAMQLIVAAARDAGVAVERCAPERLNQIAARARHQGVIALVAPASLLDENGLMALIAQRKQPLVLALDGVQDPHNLGACLRTAEAAGADAVIMPRNRAVGVTASVRKVASGAADFIPVAQVTNLARTLQSLAAAGVWVYGAAAGEATVLYDLDLTGGVCLVLGGEAGGLRRLSREHCDALYSIPMSGEVESLNVSVAAGISLFEALRQRRSRS